MFKNMSAMQKTWVQSLDQEDALEKQMATPVLENSTDRGALWATVHGVAKKLAPKKCLAQSRCSIIL